MKERGTIEHLLVMPVSANQIALSKIISNGVVIAMAAFLSLMFVVQGWLGVQINGSIALYMLGTFVFLFSASAMGIMFSTLAPTFATIWTIVVAGVCGFTTNIRRRCPL